MPANGFGWPGSVFTVGTCRGLLLALLLEPSIVTTVSDIMLRRSSRSGSPHALGRTSARLSRSERRRGVNTRGSKMENRTGTTRRADRGTPVVCIHHGPRERRPLPLHTTYGINSGAAILPLLLLATAAVHSAGSIDEVVNLCKIYLHSEFTHIL